LLWKRTFADARTRETVGRVEICPVNLNYRFTISLLASCVHEHQREVLMNFTSRTNVQRVLSAFLILAVVGLTGWLNHAVPVPAAVNRGQNTFIAPGAAPMDDVLQNGPQAVTTRAFQMANGAYYQPISSWYKNKHWWKRNAPIVGGAGGGALVGGLVGGGTGALVGGAVGGGGGYVYKRSRRHHHHYHYR
jgi:hypothetical protein